MKKGLLIAGAVIVILAAGFIILGKKMKSEKPVYIEFTKIEKAPFIHSFLVSGKITSRKIETVKATEIGIITDMGVLNKAFVKEGDLIASIQLLEEEHVKKKRQYDLNKIDLELAVKQHELKIELYKAKAISERELKQSEIQLLKQQLQSDNLKKEISAKRLEATFDGMLVNKKFTNNDRVRSGKTLYTLIDINELCVELRVYQEDMVNCRIGQKVLYESESLDSTLSGEILEISTVAVDNENQGRRNESIPIFNVYCSINMEPDKDVLFGSRLETRVVLEEIDSLITVPLEAVLYREDKKIVMIKQAGLAVEKVVTTGRYNDKMIEILSGINEGDEVILKGNMDVKDGSPVTDDKDKAGKKMKMEF